MKLRQSRNFSSNYRFVWPALLIMMIVSTVLVGGLLAQGAQNQGGMMMQAQAPARVAPSWELSERWSPATSASCFLTPASQSALVRAV